MSLAEIEFAFFFPALLLVYWLLPRRTNWQNALLLAASYLFYASWNPRLLTVLLLSTAVDYLVARYLARQPTVAEAAKQQDGRRGRRAALSLSLACNLGLLGYFKYAGFFAESLNALLGALGLPDALPVLRIALPVGISFYTLQKIGYVLDVFYGRLEPCRSALAFATFVAFFPQLLAGPITRGGPMLPQFSAPRRLTPQAVSSGASAFLLGFVLKAYVADLLARELVDPVFAAPGAYARGAHWAALLGYAAQVFGDFAGYSLMAIGVGRLLGFELPQNFNYPFLSKSLPELWQRWHITLNTWLFDYLYGPMVTSRGLLRGRLDLGFLLVFGASGLWHGATWTFVFWGVWHGLGLAAHRRWDEFYRGLCRKDRSYVVLRRSAGYAAAAWLLTQSFFLLSLVPFRAPSLAAAGSFARGLLSAPGERWPELPPVSLALCAAFLLGYHLLALSRGRGAWERFVALPGPIRGMAYGLIVVFLLLFVPKGAGTFIYAQF